MVGVGVGVRGGGGAGGGWVVGRWRACQRACVRARGELGGEGGVGGSTCPSPGTSATTWAPLRTGSACRSSTVRTIANCRICLL
jgi:hypothetical protein